MNDGWNRRELELRRSLGIDYLVDNALKSDIGGITEKANQRVVDIAVVTVAFPIAAAIRRPAKNLSREYIVSLDQMVSIGGAALSRILNIKEVFRGNPFVG